MTCGLVLLSCDRRNLGGEAVSHLAELVRGYWCKTEGPLIRPSGTFSPRGEGFLHGRFGDLAEVSRGT